MSSTLSESGAAKEGGSLPEVAGMNSSGTLMEVFQDVKSQFVTSQPVSSSHTCAECEEIMLQPRQTYEGYRICRMCLSAALLCKRDSTEIKGISMVDPDNREQRGVREDKACLKEIMRISVKCKWQKEGCRFESTLKDFSALHVGKCPFRVVKCSNGDCTELVPAVELQCHMESVCQYQPVECSQCATSVERMNLNEHVSPRSSVAVDVKTKDENAKHAFP